MSKRGIARLDPFSMVDNRINFVSVPAEVEVLQVLLLGDLHAGHFCHNEALLDFYLHKLDENPAMRCLILGDLFEAKMRGSKGKPEEQVLPITQQRKYLVQKLKPYADRIDGVVPGNHEERQSNEGGDDLTEVLCNELGVKHYFNPVGMVVYYSERVRACAYTVGIRHGNAGGFMIGSGLNAAQRDVYNMIADVYVEGHCHKLTEGPKQGALKPDFQNRCGVVSIYKVITNGSLLDPRRSYAAMKGYTLAMPEQGILQLDMRKGKKSIGLKRE
jgi:hypothetical protein